MILLLLIGIVLAGLAAALLARAVANPLRAGSAPSAQIGRYGFNKGAKERPKADVGGIVDRAADSLGGRFAGNFGNAEEIRRQLVAAGMYRVTATKFLGYRILATIGLPLIWIWFATTTSRSPVVGFLGTVAAILIGWFAPLRIVKDRAKRRLNEIDYELPELIDLLVVTVEAGLGFVGSLQMASDRLTGTLGQELRLTLQEQNMGLSINEALANTMARCDTPSMRSFVRSIVQGETLGVSIGQIMRDLATEMRRRRKQSAEERAQKAPIKILFPLVFLIFPAMFVVLLGPALIQFLHAIRGVAH
ncbi:MAG TPA: type II secretion system F family protein [Gaiellaceae bacterium]